MLNDIIIFIAKYALYIALLIWVAYWLSLPRASKVTLAIRTVAGGIIALALAKLGNHLYNNPRPFDVGHFTPLIHHAADNGFPSDHTLLASLIGFAALTMSRRVGVLLLALAVLIGGARVDAGVHHLIDIIGSIVIAGVAMGIVLLAERWWRHRQTQATSPKSQSKPSQ